MRESIQAWLGAVGAHPSLVLAVVFAAACTEAIALIGTVVPAGIVLFSAGALVGAGALDGWATVAVASAGAIVGDGISYEIGRRYRQAIQGGSTRIGYAHVYARGEQFVHRHGVKSIVLARFIPPLRAVVPVVVGCAHMPRRTFYPVNAASALVWAPAHIVPGIVFGASAALAEAVSARLATILIVIAALVWAVWVGVRVAIRRGVPLVRRASAAAARAFARGFPRVASRAGRLTLRGRRVPGALVLLFVGSVWLFAGVIQDIVANDPLMRADTAIYTLLQSLRTTPVDAAMTGLMVLNGRHAGWIVAAAFAAWLVIHRCWRTLAWWLATVGVAVVLVPDAGLASHGTLPVDWQPGSPHAPLPDGDAAIGALASGFMGWLMTRGQPAFWRSGVATALALWVVLGGFARLYLGQAWLSGLLAGWSLGLAWFAVLGGAFAYWRIRDEVQPRGALCAVAVVLATVGVWTVPQQWRADREQRAHARAAVTMTVPQWMRGGWRQVPTRRMEISGDREEFLPLQWRAESAALDQHLALAGWRRAPEWSAQTALGWLMPQTPAGDLPVLPRFSQGESTRRVFVRADPQHPGTRLVLRLWRDRHALQDAQGARPLWYGALYRETLRHPGRLLTIARTEAIGRAPEIEQALAVRASIVHPPAGAAAMPAEILLVPASD